MQTKGIVASKRLSIFFCSLSIAFLCLVSSCGNKTLSPKDYMEWVNKPSSAINYQKEIGEYTIQLRYLPHDFLVLQNLPDKNAGINEDEYQKEKAKYDGHKYFLFRIKSTEKSASPMHTDLYSYDEYQSRLNYLAFEAGNDFKVIEGKDTLECVLNHFENNYNSAPVNDIFLVFKEKSTTAADELTFIWNDKMFGLGTIKFTIDQAEILNNTPALKIN